MQRRDLEDYLNSVADKLGELGGRFVRGPYIDISERESTGILETELDFATGHRLHVALTAVGPDNFPEWPDYSFQFMDSEDKCVFRYDNSPHHPGGTHFPEHKHAGEDETLIDHARPSLRQVIDEIRSRIYE